MSLKAPIKVALKKNGYLEATKIQEDVIIDALLGKNIVGQSQTGTGKTAAFVIPLLEMIDSNKRKPQAIILAPTRELAIQIRDEVFKLSEGMFVRSTVVYGGSNIRTQREVLEKGPQIVIATPGRLIDLVDRRYIDLSDVNFFVLDEVDRMLDMGFIDDIDYLWGHMPNIKQSMTFSATIPKEMQNLITKYVGADYTSIKANAEITVDKIDHAFIEVEAFDKFNLLKEYVEKFEGKKVVVFSRTKHEAEHIARMLYENGVKAGYLHGDMEQRARNNALRAFKEGMVNVFVTTDVAARGLNMNNIELVVNFHVPEDPEAYIHRIGRTGRAGADGQAIMFVSKSESLHLKNIEKRNKIRIKQIDKSGNEVVRKEEDPRGWREGKSRFGRGRGRSGGGYRGRGGDRDGRSWGFGGGAASGGEFNQFADHGTSSSGGGFPRRSPEGGSRGGRSWGFGGGGGYDHKRPSRPHGGFGGGRPQGGGDDWSTFGR